MYTLSTRFGMPLWMPYDRLYSKFQLDRVETPAAGTAGVAGNRPDCNRSIVVVAAPHVAARSRRSHPPRTCKWAAPGRSLLPRTHARTRLGSPPPRLQFGQWRSGVQDGFSGRMICDSSLSGRARAVVTSARVVAVGAAAAPPPHSSRKNAMLGQRLFAS